MCSCRFRADCGDGILGNGLAALFEGLDEPGERAEIVKDQAICDQVLVFDGLPLFVAAVFHDDPFPSEEGPLEEAIVPSRRRIVEALMRPALIESTTRSMSGR
jgi:hypothetical protein